jgi:hypothetical protein
VPEEHAVITMLKDLEPDKLTPREALDLIFAMKSKID